MIALSTISMIAIEIVSAASATGITAVERHAGAQQRQGRERVAEEERQRDRERDGGAVGPPERGADDHAEDLADRTAGEAVQRRAEGDAQSRLGAVLVSRVMIVSGAVSVVLVCGHDEFLYPRRMSRATAAMISSVLSALVAGDAMARMVVQ